MTCEDWDGSQYLSNVVVVALPSPEVARGMAAVARASGIGWPLRWFGKVIAFSTKQ